MARRILCLWLPHWPIQRLVVQRPELRDRPLILYRVQGSRGKRVTACSRRAREAGVRPGMTVAEASALSAVTSREAAKKKEAHVEHWDVEEDQVRLKELAEWAEQYTPWVGWQTIGELPWRMTDGLLLDIGGTAKVLGGESVLAQRIVREVQCLGYHPRVAVAETPGAAFAAVRYATSFREPVCLMGGSGPTIGPTIGATMGATGSASAKNEGATGSASAKNEGATDSASASPLSSPVSSKDLWRRLPVEALRLEPDTVALLHRLGVLHWHELSALPRSSLAARLGQQPAIRMAQLTGEILEQIEPHRPPPPFRESCALEYPTANRETLDNLTQQLLDRLAKHLRQEGQGVLRLLCSFHSQNLLNTVSPALSTVPAADKVLEIDVGLFRPTASSSHLWSLVQMQLEQSVISVAVRKVVVEVVVASPLRQKQGELFGENKRRPREVANLLERLSSRLGREAVLQTKLRREPLPEDTYVEQPAAGQKLRTGLKALRGSSGEAAHDPLERPLFFYHPPRPLQVELKQKVELKTGELKTGELKTGELKTGELKTGELKTGELKTGELKTGELKTGELKTGREPGRVLLTFDGTKHGWYEVAQFWGPERLETSWWRGPSVRRDYFRIEISTGERFWIFRRVDDDYWFLHGAFG